MKERGTRRWWSPWRARLWLRLCATSDTLCREHGRSCCDGGRCEDGPWRAAHHHGVRSAQLSIGHSCGGSGDRLFAVGVLFVTTVCARLMADCSSWRRVPRSSERALSAPESGKPVCFHSPARPDQQHRSSTALLHCGQQRSVDRASRSPRCALRGRGGLLLVATSFALLRASAECS